MIIDQLVYTIPQAIQMAAVSRTALYRCIQRGELTILKRGKRSLILAEELRRWVQALPTAQQAKAA
jgi:excisionase family DNA binding protein